MIGAILGLVGSVSTKAFGIFEKREERKLVALQMDHESKRWSHDEHMFTLQSQAKVAETEQEAFLMTTQGSYDGLKASIEAQSEATKGSSKWVKNIISLMRPSLTTSFVGVIIYLCIIGNPDDIRIAAITAVIELGSMSVAWWFGDRSTKRVMESMRGGHIRGAGGEF